MKPSIGNFRQKDLASIAGVSTATISRFINGKCRLNAVSFVKICQALGCEGPELVEQFTGAA